MRVPALFGGTFAGPSWAPWRAFVAAVFALPMSEEQAALYRKHTGRTKLPVEPAREVWCIAGRRAGKSIIAALLAIFAACFRSYAECLAPGERATVAVIAADRQQARVVFRYIVGLIDAAPFLRKLVVRSRASSLELVGRVVIEVHTCSY